MKKKERRQDEPGRPDPRDVERHRERAHERASDDPGRGQGDVLDDKIPHESDDEEP